MRLSNPAWPWVVYKVGSGYVVKRWEEDYYEAMPFKEYEAALDYAKRANMEDYGMEFDLKIYEEHT